MSEKNYIGKGKTIKTKYGNLLSMGLRKDVLQELINSTEGNFINLTCGALKETDKWGNTHTIWESPKAAPESNNEPEKEVYDDSLPF